MLQRVLGFPERVKAFRSLGKVDDRLKQSPSGADITDPTSGGFLVQPNFSQQIITAAYGEALIAGQCDRRLTSRPLADVKFPGIDETSRADGSRFGGVVSYWGDEATQVAKSKPRWKNLNMSTRKLIAFVAGNLPAPSRYGAVWLANEDVDEQLEQLAGNPVTYIPAGVNGNEYPLLKGRPVLTIEQCPTLGAPGDLVLADLSKYIIVDGGINTMLSFHVLFDSDEVSFRFTLRVDGKPGFASAITPYNGGTTRSPYIALGAR
jgi:hypothetical protein